MNVKMIEPPADHTADALTEPGRRSWYAGLSARLLALTVAFIMLCEVLILAPSVGRFRVQYFAMKLEAAHLTLTALKAAEMVDADLQRRLLNQAGVLGMTVIRPGMPARTLGPDMPAKALENLFVPFSGSARSGGSGLGLPISREAIRAQGGDLFLKETAASGTVLASRLMT